MFGQLFEVLLSVKSHLFVKEILKFERLSSVELEVEKGYDTMKKIICLLLVMLITGSVLTACNFNTNFSDSTGQTQMDAKPKVEEMLLALAAADTQTAISLMHPNVTLAEEAFDQQIQFLNGRKAETIEQMKWRCAYANGRNVSGRCQA